MTIVALFGFAGVAVADPSNPIKPMGPGARIARPIAVNEGDANPNAPFVAPPVNDTCAGAIPLTLNVTTKGTTVGANDDYQTPADTTCYAGIGQTPTRAPGRDVVYRFTAPFDGRYSFRIIQQSPNDVIATQNEVLYLTDCANEGTVTCFAGANRPQSAVFASSAGASNNQSEEVVCYPMTQLQTVYVVFDDAAPGNCSGDSHACFDDSNCPDGQTCNPALNAGGAMSVEVIDCFSEIEPNDTPATAYPPLSVCGRVGVSDVAPIAHCYLGTRAGSVCTRSTFLEQSLPNSNMRCSISGNRCAVDVVSGVGDCAAGEGLCQQLTDLDCDPRCDVGPNAGKSCTTQVFCNPGGDQGATCAGTCQVESTCVTTATGLDTGVACTPVCTGSSIPSVNGRFCSALSGCPGGGVCTQSPLVPVPGATCSAGQTCSRQYNEGDTDYFSVGTPPAGSKVFAGLDAKSANDYDWRMRVTTATNTLQMDDDDVTVRGGSNAPAIAGAVTDGTETFVQVSRTSPRTSAPYELYGIVRPPPAAAQLEDETGPTGNDLYYGWPGDVINANPIADDGYVRGDFGFQGDTDCFKFLVYEGTIMNWFGDGGPGRTNGPVSQVNIPQPIIYDAEPAGISGFLFAANPRKNTAANVQGPGLRALSPAVTSSYFQWRAGYSGMMEVCFYDASAALGQGTPSHPSAWVGSISGQCSIGVTCCGGPCSTTEVAMTKTGPAGPVPTGQFAVYTITVRNLGAEIAQEVRLADVLDEHLSFVSLTVDDGFGGNNTACFSLPTPGTANAPIDCINTSMAPFTFTTYTLTVQVHNCIGSGVAITNTASITMVSTDPDHTNNEATWSFTTSEDGSCVDLACGDTSCVPDLCTSGDHCEEGVCVAAPANCDDNNLCTVDVCDPVTGCVHDSSQSGDLCDDFNACTTNACDPLQFCVFPPAPQGTSCDDGLAGTCDDQCDGAGACAGSSDCDDNNPCTDDRCDPIVGCAHTNTTNPCDDGNACTANDACGGGTCHGGAPPDCNDGNPCTDDSCDPTLGCRSVPNTSCQVSPKTQGFWRRLCAGPHPEGSITQSDVECVNDSCAFASVHTLAELCDRLTPDPSNDKCEQAESQFMALMLNHCQNRLTDLAPIDSECTAHTTVGPSRAEADALLCSGTRNPTTCTMAQCESEELNSGRALLTNSLRLAPLPDGSLRLTWDPPYGISDLGPPQGYVVRRRTSSETPYQQVASTPELWCVDTTSTGGAFFEYDVVPVW